MNFSEGQTYENFIKQFLPHKLNSEIVCIVNGTSVKLFKNLKEIPTDLHFIECLNGDEYYFRGPDPQGADVARYCFFAEIGKKLFILWRGTHKNKFLEKKIITIAAGGATVTVFAARAETLQVDVREI